MCNKLAVKKIVRRLLRICLKRKLQNVAVELKSNQTDAHTKTK